MRLVFLYIFTLLAGVSAVNAQTLEQWRDSLDVLNRQIAVDRESVPLHLDRAALNLQMLEWEDAVDDCNFVLQRDPVSLSALYYRAYANNNLRRHDLAKNDYEDFLRLSPRNMEAKLGLAYTYIKLNRHSDALDQMNNLVEMYPDSSVVYAARAGVEGEMNLYDTALFDWSEAILRDPGNSDYVISKVEILLILGKKREARAVLDEAVDNGVPRGILREWYSKCR